MSLLSSFIRANLTEIVSPLFGLNYWIGFSFSFLGIASLFIFRGFFAQVSKKNYFRYTLGILQILLFILYYTFHAVSGDISWQECVPFQLCSVLDLTSAFLLLYPCEKLFSITFPLIGPVILAFLLPDVSKRVYGLDNFFFYQFYLNHLIIFFGYFYLYFYGHIKYNKLMLTQSCVFVTIFALIVFVFNIVFGTNFLFIGSDGFELSNKHWFLSTGNWNPIFRFLFMWLIGLGFILLFNFVINKYAPPFYFNAGEKKNEYYYKKKLSTNKIKNIKSRKKCQKMPKESNINVK